MLTGNSVTPAVSGRSNAALVPTPMKLTPLLLRSTRNFTFWASDPAAVRRRKRTMVPSAGDLGWAPGSSTCAAVHASVQASA